MRGVPFFEVLSTRVRRGYTGGAQLERWTGEGEGRDGNRPEDWIASTTEARNPGMDAIPGEGLTRVRRPDGVVSDLRAEIAADPHYHLGAEHVQARGRELGFLAKILDSSIRLHIQAHPTAAFAQARLQSRYGKLEAYVILGVRPGCEAYALLGFNQAPAREEWRRIITGQDVVAMEACLNRVPLAPGEVWLVPGGMPHAIGEGVLMIEVMEPSDWVVRCEFERGGLVVPPAGRYMGRDLDFCLDVFDYRSAGPEEIRRRCRLAPRLIETFAGGAREELVGPAQTDCFQVQRLRARAAVAVPATGRMRLLVVTAGRGRLEGDGSTIPLEPGSRVLVPAQSAHGRIVPEAGATLEAVMCQPG
jgi:mannose-6-phosphate isomerase